MQGTMPGPKHSESAQRGGHRPRRMRGREEEEEGQRACRVGSWQARLERKTKEDRRWSCGAPCTAHCVVYAKSRLRALRPGLQGTSVQEKKRASGGPEELVEEPRFVLFAGVPPTTRGHCCDEAALGKANLFVIVSLSGTGSAPPAGTFYFGHGPLPAPTRINGDSGLPLFPPPPAPPG